MKAFWNDRYSKLDYAYGTKPNVFLKETLDLYKPTGSILFPAEGEGRNAVYAAQRGLDVYAFDISENAQKKALKLAEHNKVDINYQVGDIDSIDLKGLTFDVVGLVFAHFPPNIRKAYHQKFIDLLRPGGLVILEGFAKENLKYREANPQVGGPGNIEMLFSTDTIQSDFAALETILLQEQDVELKEGQFHVGTARTIRYIGRKTQI